jgi:hypothetical protein
MKKITLSLVFAIVSLSAFSNNIEPKKWNNNGADKAQFKKGDTVTVKAGTKSAKYVLSGKVEAVCNANYIKVDGYFIAISDVDAITKYYHVK